MPPHEIIPNDDGSVLVKFMAEEVPDADIYVLQRRMEPHWVVLSNALRDFGKTVIAETDDWFLGTPSYNVASRGASPYKRSFKVEHDHKGVPHITAIRRERKFANRDNMHAGFSAADAMTVTTKFLAREYARFQPDVTVIPNRLEWDVWRDTQPQYEVNRDKVRIGWFGKLAWRRGDLNVLRGMIGPFLRRHPEVEFVASGEPDEGIHDYLEIPEGQRVTYSEATFHELPSITAVMDIGLVPLEENNFNSAKSDLKGQEYAACGVPCVASPTESYRDWVQEGTNGFLARRPKDWVRHMETLVSDHELRDRMGRNARAKAESHALHNHVDEYEGYLSSKLKGETRDVNELWERLSA